jgi:hypothetical protein
MLTLDVINSYVHRMYFISLRLYGGFTIIYTGIWYSKTDNSSFAQSLLYLRTATGSTLNTDLICSIIVSINLLNE